MTHQALVYFKRIKNNELYQEVNCDGLGENCPFLLNQLFIGLQIKTNEVRKQQGKQRNEQIDDDDDPPWRI